MVHGCLAHQPRRAAHGFLLTVTLLTLLGIRGRKSMSVKVLTPAEYAEALGVSPQHVRRCCESGSIKAIRLSAGDKRTVWRIPFDREAIEEMALANASAPIERKEDAKDF